MVDEGQSKRPGTGMSIPGQPTEEAIAAVGTDAGRSLVRGFARLSDSLLGPWLASREAKAASAKLTIETQGKIEAHQAVIEARRRFEIEEAKHQSLLDRRAQRLRVELAREQENLESIQRKAIEFTNRTPIVPMRRKLTGIGCSDALISPRKCPMQTSNFCGHEC